MLMKLTSTPTITCFQCARSMSDIVLAGSRGDVMRPVTAGPGNRSLDAQANCTGS